MPSSGEAQPSVHDPDQDIVVIDEETAVKEPGLASSPADREAAAMPPTGTGAADAASPMAASEPPSAPPAGAGGTGAAPPPAGAERRWREIQAMFVDDPRGSVQRAADLIDTMIEELIAPIRGRQAALASSWHDRDTDTEALRVVLKDYRAFWTVVRDIPPMAGAAGGHAADGAGPASTGAGAGPGTAYGAGPGSVSGANEPRRGREPG